jgi:uncharacterized protein YjbI with pentapeptide repeats
MADEDHIKVLHQGCNLWNAWRKTEPLIEPDFSGANLSGANLSGANLSGANLSGANLSGANLSGANLSEANLSDAELLGADLSGANLSPTCLRRAKLNAARLCRADLSRAYLDQANLSEANLIGAKLRGATLYMTNLSGANLVGANLRGATFANTNLRGADLCGADLRGTNLSAANLSGANLSKANLSRVDLGGADLRRMNLTATNLSKANLRGANLGKRVGGAKFDGGIRGNNLSGAKLRGADLSGADLSGANLLMTDLREADLRYVNLVEADLTDADLTGSRVYGISAWGLKLSKGTKQQELVITDKDEPDITVDNIEVAQFVYLLLHNEKIRGIIDTIGRRGVLLLGRFTGGRIAILERLREELRNRGFVPIVFNFDKPETKDFTETVRLLAGLSHFVIVDITNPRSAPLELQAIVPECMVPFVPILEKAEEPFSMLTDLWIKHRDWVLDPIRYPSLDRLIEVLDAEIVEPAKVRFAQLLARKAEELRIKDI